MSFREKSAWAMGAVMILTGLLWFLHMDWAVNGDHVHIFDIAHFVIAVVVLSIIVQVVLAITNRGEARKPADERERIAIDRAGNWSGIVLAFGVISAAGNYLFWQDGNLLLQWIVGALIVAQTADYAFQVYLFRRGA